MVIDTLYWDKVVVTRGHELHDDRVRIITYHKATVMFDSNWISISSIEKSVRYEEVIFDRLTNFGFTARAFEDEDRAIIIEGYF